MRDRLNYSPKFASTSIGFASPNRNCLEKLTIYVDLVQSIYWLVGWLDGYKLKIIKNLKNINYFYDVKM